jgi:sporulation protein YlmC with PRC-barrel domain
MTMRLSRLYGMDIYSDGGKYLGRVIDLIMDLEKGEVVRMTMQPLTAISRDEARRVLREASVLYKNVKSVEDVVVVTRGSTSEKLVELPEEEVRGFGR